MHLNLLFDLDQTLLDFHASEHLALKEVMEANGQDFSEERYRFFKQVNKSLWLEFEKGMITKSELFEKRFRLLFEECGCDTGSMELLKINDSFIDCMSQNGVLMDGALAFLRNIAENIPNARIYIITNGAEHNALGRIASTGLDRYVNKVFISETLGTAKPSREFFDIVKKTIAEPDESFIVIGDSLTSDMLGAQNAGLASCWFMPEGDTAAAVKEYDIDFTASSFDELYDIIKSWPAAHMHRIFGKKENASYFDREGAYLIPVSGDKVGIVQTPKGYFLLGGGIESGESHTGCIKRECLEEAGYEVCVGEKLCSAETYCFHEKFGFFHPIQTYYAGELRSKTASPTESDHKFLWIEYEKVKGKMFLEMQDWALKTAFEKYRKEQPCTTA